MQTDTDVKNPIKLIWKYKNSVGSVQYNTYIFVGNLVPKKLMVILKKIEKLPFIDSLKEITKQDYDDMKEYYGERWIEKFFNIYHINNSIKILKRDDEQNEKYIRDIKTKMGLDTYNNLFNNEIVDKEIIYSYETMIKNANIGTKVRSKSVVIDDKENMSYILAKTGGGKIEDFEVDVNKKENTVFGIVNKDNVENMIEFLNSEMGKYEKEQNGGANDDDDNEDDDDDDGDIVYGDDDVSEDNEGEDNYEQLENRESMIYDDLYEDEDITENVNAIFDDESDNIDKKADQTSDLIRKALDNSKIYEENIKKMADFDMSNMQNIHSTNLFDIYEKVYITTQFIYRDDSIKNIKNKICCSIKMSKHIDENLYLIPSRQYFWTEYFFNGKIQKLSLGQKWMKNNTLLPIDIEPTTNLKIYEELRGNIKDLKNNLKRHNNIRFEDDSNNILLEYDKYMKHNEIYMLDIYHDLGKKYGNDRQHDAIKNIQDTYMYLYYPHIKTHDIKPILECLNNESKNEEKKNMTMFDTINNDLIMENEIVSTVEKTKLENNYKKLFTDNYITQSVIHVNVTLENTELDEMITKKIDLYRIINNFELNDEYPFIQYQTPDGNIFFKFDIKNLHRLLINNKNLIVKWFENVSYGLSFKYVIDITNRDNFISINLNDVGRIEYKTQWKAEDKATLKHIENSYVYIYKLINKINKEKSELKLTVPNDYDFKYAFINTIQTFVLPNNSIINHNDLSNFARYFYPYIALVIEPKKRQSKKKISNASKFGTYLRYKKVNDYDNKNKMEQRILYFMKNYDYTEKEFILEISKQFNITEQIALEEYNKVKSKFPTVKKARRTLDRIENAPRYKSAGIGCDIQGKEPSKYKIRISGARDKEQLYRLINFMNIFIFLYAEVYIQKNPKYLIIKKKLESLKNIAMRRQKVDEFVDYTKEISEIKNITQNDKERLGFKPKVGESQYSRYCQNSGKKRRRPIQIVGKKMDELLKMGYKYNKTNKIYEKKVNVKRNGKMVQETLFALEEQNEKGESVFYITTLENNGEYYHIGYLKKSKNPDGLCMPCGFKKQQLFTDDEEKNKFYDSCKNPTAIVVNVEEEETARNENEKMYVLQESAKLLEGRISFLPKLLDLFLNTGLKNDKKIRNNYLTESLNGYYFKYGIKSDTNTFMESISVIFDIPIETIIKNIEKVLKKNSNYFMTLSEGTIIQIHETIDNYLEYIRTSNVLADDVIDILSIPNVIHKNGINIVIFEQRETIINKVHDKDKTRTDFYLNYENINAINDLTDNELQTAILISIDDAYNPIIKIKKDNENKTVEYEKISKYDNTEKNIVNHINKYYEISFINTKLANESENLTAKIVYKALINLEKYKIKYQYLDNQYKCIYLITDNDILISVAPSGGIYNIPIIDDVKKYIKNYEITLKQMNEIDKITGKKLNLHQIGLTYANECSQCKKDEMLVKGIITGSNTIIPIEEFLKNKNDIGTLMTKRDTNYEKIDEFIESGKKIKDKRIGSINKSKYMSESYELFKFNISDFLNREDNKKLKEKFVKVVMDPEMTKLEKIIKVKLMLYKIIDNNLFEKYMELLESDKKTDILLGGGNKAFDVVETLAIDKIDKYIPNNLRQSCSVHDDKKKCDNNPHCGWNRTECSFVQTLDNYVIFINRIANELAEMETNAFEILQIDNHKLNDIADYNVFIEKEGESVLKSTNINIQDVLNEYFDNKLHLKKIKSNHSINLLKSNYSLLNQNYFIVDMKTYYIQQIANENMNLYRALANGLYWYINEYNDVSTRNLGYIHPLQTDLAINIKSKIIDWLIEDINRKKITKNIEPFIEKNNDKFFSKMINSLVNDINMNTNCVLELFIFNLIYNIPCIVFDEYQSLIYIFDGDLIYSGKNKNEKIVEKYMNNDKCINLKFLFSDNKLIPTQINSIYYK